MSIIFMDGFDKYGIKGQLLPLHATDHYPDINASMISGEWNYQFGTGGIEAPLSAKGYSFHSLWQMRKTLQDNYDTLVIGMRMKNPFSNPFGIFFTDGSDFQCSITIANVTGIMTARTGSFGTIIGTSAGPVCTQNEIFYLEIEATFTTSGLITAYVNGKPVMVASGATKTSIHDYANGIGINMGNCTIDDLYLSDQGPPFLNGPRIETFFPTNDVQTELSPIDAVSGEWRGTWDPVSNAGASTMSYCKFTPAESVSVTSLNSWTMANNLTTRYAAFIYEDTSGGTTPHNATLVASSSSGTGTTIGGIISISINATLTGGTTYWFGWATDLGLSLYCQAEAPQSFRSTHNFSDPIPDPCPAVVDIGTFGYCIWGLGSGSNHQCVNQTGALGDFAYIQSNGANQEDLYGTDGIAVSETPQFIYCVTSKGWGRKEGATGSGAMEMHLKSGGTDSSGDFHDYITTALPESYGWKASYFYNDPDTGEAWTKDTVNNSAVGPKRLS